MESELITTEYMLELGFDEKPRTFRNNGLVFKKHPTMNWLIVKNKYIKTKQELSDFLK